MAADDLALLAHRLHRRSYLHGPFPRVWPGDALWLPREQPLLRHGWRARKGAMRTRGQLKIAKPYRRRLVANYSPSAHRIEGRRRWFSRAPRCAVSELARRSQRAVALVPGRQDARPVAGDGDGELEVGRQRAVLGVDRPAVVAHAHHVP